MKKILLTSLCIAACSLFAIAQEETDINEAVRLYNDAATALAGKDFKTALTNAKQALQIATVSEDEEAADTKQKIEGLIPKIHYAEAIQFIDDKNYDAAITALNTTIEVATQYNNDEFKGLANKYIPQVLLIIANELLSAEKFAEAIPAYEKVLAVTPNDETAYLRIGQAHLKLGNETEAIAAFEKANELGSKDATKQLATLFLNKSITANSAKKWNDVVTNAQKSLSYDANNTTACKLLGLSAIQLKKWDVAIENLEKILPSERNPDNTIFNLATAYESKGNKAKACENFRKIVSNATYKAYAETKVKALCQ